MSLLLAPEIEELLEDHAAPCISLYFPVFHSGARTQQGPIRLKNLLARVEQDLLQARGLEPAAVKALLAPLEKLRDDPSLWTPLEEGVALFCAPGFLRVVRLPQPFAERWVVGERFFVKPLLPWVSEDRTFYVLALSQNQVRLLQATGRTVRRLEPKGLPHSLAGALGEQTTTQTLTYHTASSAAAGARAPIYHGRGLDDSDTKSELRRFLHVVERAVTGHLAGHPAPLVLAGAEPLPSIYRELTGYAALEANVLSGNPETLSDEVLRDRAWQLLQPAAREVRSRVEKRYGELAGTGQASNDLAEILPAARHGRVEALFVACEKDLWGRIDSQDQVVVHAAPEAGDEELLETVALLSLRNGGTVYGLSGGPVPGGGDVAAVFRY